MWPGPGDNAGTLGHQVPMLVELQEAGVESFTLVVYHYAQHTYQ